MSAASDYTENKLLDHVLTSTSYASPNATLYLALFTSDGGLENDTEGSQTEISGNAYVRKQLLFQPLQVDQHLTQAQ
jgi:hypothetical protein